MRVRPRCLLPRGRRATVTAKDPHRQGSHNDSGTHKLDEAEVDVSGAARDRKPLIVRRRLPRCLHPSHATHKRPLSVRRRCQPARAPRATAHASAQNRGDTNQLTPAVSAAAAAHRDKRGDDEAAERRSQRVSHLSPRRLRRQMSLLY